MSSRPPYVDDGNLGNFLNYIKTYMTNTGGYTSGQTRQGAVPTKGSKQAPSIATYRTVSAGGKVSPFSKKP